jgi:hypothetical protein
MQPRLLIIILPWIARLITSFLPLPFPSSLGKRLPKGSGSQRQSIALLLLTITRGVLSWRHGCNTPARAVCPTGARPLPWALPQARYTTSRSSRGHRFPPGASPPRHSGRSCRCPWGDLHDLLAEAIDLVLIGAPGGHDLMEPPLRVIDKLLNAVPGHAPIGVVAEAPHLRPRHALKLMAIRGIGI